MEIGAITGEIAHHERRRLFRDGAIAARPIAFCVVATPIGVIAAHFHAPLLIFLAVAIKLQDFRSVIAARGIEIETLSAADIDDARKTALGVFHAPALRRRVGP